MMSVCRIEIEWFHCRASAKRAEASAIKAERPLWNIAHNGPVKRSKPLGCPKALIDRAMSEMREAMTAFNALPDAAEIIAEMNRVDPKAPKMTSTGSYGNWKAQGFPGFIRPEPES